MKTLIEQASDFLRAGSSLSHAYNSHFFDLGRIVLDLQTVVSVELEGGTEERELWTTIAPAGESSLLSWLVGEWDVPRSTLSAAGTFVNFYHRTLGWPMSDLLTIGRARLSAAKEWLQTSRNYGALDETLTGMLQQQEPVRAIEAYSAEARKRFSEITHNVKTASLGERSKPANAMPEKAWYDHDSDTLTVKGSASPYTDSEAATAAAGAMDSLVHMETATKTPTVEPLAVTTIKEDNLSTVIWRVIYPILQAHIFQPLNPGSEPNQDSEWDEKASTAYEETREALESYFGGEFIVPLISWIDDVPYNVGLIMVQNGPEGVSDRVLKYLQKNLKAIK